jgi:hypothetical protein
MAQAYNPSYSGGRNQEDCSLKPVLANSLGRPYSQKRAGRIGPDFKLQYHQKKKRKKERKEILSLL